MNNLEELINYTKEKKQFQLTKLVTHLSESEKKINGYLKGVEHVTTVGTSLNYISIWNHWNYIITSLKDRIGSVPFFAESTYFGIEANNWDFFLGKKVEKYKQSIQFHKAIKHMAQAFLLGWDDLAIDYGHLLIKMLYGKQYQGWHSGYRHPWFMLEIFCRWQHIELDYEKLNYPKDLTIYAEVLEHWKTNDPFLLSQLVNKMVRFHIEQSDEDEYEDKTPDFPSSDYFIFAIEICFWLNIRSRLGLVSYQSDNDLMKLEINNWSTLNVEIPKIDLIEQAKSRLLEDYPGIEFEL